MNTVLPDLPLHIFHMKGAFNERKISHIHKRGTEVEKACGYTAVTRSDS